MLKKVYQGKMHRKALYLAVIFNASIELKISNRFINDEFKNTNVVFWSVTFLLNIFFFFLKKIWMLNDNLVCEYNPWEYLLLFSILNCIKSVYLYEWHSWCETCYSENYEMNSIGWQGYNKIFC